jgi:hypothetical protein
VTEHTTNTPSTKAERRARLAMGKFFGLFYRRLREMRETVDRQEVQIQSMHDALDDLRGEWRLLARQVAKLESREWTEPSSDVNMHDATEVIDGAYTEALHRLGDPGTDDLRQLDADYTQYLKAEGRFPHDEPRH